MISQNTSENKSKPVSSVNTEDKIEKKEYGTTLIEAQSITCQIDLELLFGEIIDLSKNELYNLEFNDLIDNKTASINVHFIPKTES